MGLDVGNTRLSAAVVSDRGELMAVQRHDTPGDVEATIAALEGMVAQLTGGADLGISAVGIGFGGPVDLATGRIRRSHQSAGWEDVRLGEILARRLGLVTYLANDANAGGLGEALFGAARDAQSLLYVNVGTGIGGAIVLGGRIHAGATSTAGEIGHCTVLPDGPRCTCGKRGCLEALSSGAALERRARELLAQAKTPDSALHAIPTDDLTGRDVGRAAAQGDVLALKVVEGAAHFLGIGLANAVNLVDPEVVVLGGGVPEMGDIFLEPARDSFRGHALPAVTTTPLLPAKLGYDAGVIGAAAVALTEQGARSEH